MKNTKKGFTLVELLVVIAIVAILATVAIIGYTSFLKKADLSNDQSAIAQMNTALQASAIPNGFENPSDAIDALYNVGWNFGKMQPYSNNFKYAYNYTENKMYLIDDKGDVVYPEAADKAKLWGIYDDASNEIIDGITNYIVLGNISSTDHFESAFGNANNYVIDLNDFCIKVDGEYANVKLINGGLISGAFSADSSITEYEAYEGTVAGSNASYKNVAFNDFKVESSESTWWSNVTFENCVFYNSSIRTYGNVKFVNCQFINSADFDSQNIDIYNQGKEFDEYTVIFEHCSFSGGYRAINVTGANPTTTNIIIDGCEFNGIDKDKQMIQVASDNINVEIKNTKFNALGKALSLIEIEKADTTFTCTNNTINSDIPVEQYVTVDGTATAEQDTEVTNMLK